jgi:branched-chain amino acid transport system permease protein
LEVTRAIGAPTIAPIGRHLGRYVLGALGFGLLAAVPLVVSDQYLLFMLSVSVIYAIVALGLNLTNGYLGMLNLSVAGQVALGAYGCAILALRGIPLPLAIAASVVCGAVVAALVFLIFARLHGFFFGLGTIAAAEVIRLLIRNLEAVTNGVRGLRGFSHLTDSPATTYVVLVSCLSAVMLLSAVTIHSSVGLRWRAIRENRGKALSLGIPVARYQFGGFVLSGAIMSFGGALLAPLLQYIEPNIAGLNTLVQTVLMVALGGAGTLFGPIVGALAITLLPEFLRMANELRLVIYGVALILVVLTLPGGLLGFIIGKLRVRRRMARSQAQQESGVG